MSAPTIVFNENYERVITLSRNGERVTHVFPDHWLELRELYENGRGPIYYIIAHNYGTGEETLVFLKDQKEYMVFERELNRPMDEAANFKKSVEAYKAQIGKSFVKAVEVARCLKFCDDSLAEAETRRQPVEVGFFGVETRVSDEDLKELCCKPLEATTDPLRLKELEGRFPGATMVLSLSSHQVVVKYVYEDIYVDSSANHKIACDVVSPLPLFDFASLGCKGKTQLMAEWRGMYIDLSHLF
jgi:hypothetical protein